MRFNEQRKLIRNLYRIRSEKPQNLSTVESYVLTRIGIIVRVEKHIAILGEGLATLNQRNGRPKDRIKVILEGSCYEPALFDYALYRRALEKEGIPHLYLEFEEKMWIFDKAKTEVETFVESMLFD